MRLSTRSPSAATRAVPSLYKILVFIAIFLSIGLFASGVQAAELPCHSQPLAAARRAGPGASLGLMQIQRRWLAQLGVPLERAFDPEANVRLGARILRLALDRHGLRAGIEAYHGQPGRRCTAAYRLRVLRLALALSSAPAATSAATSAGDPVPTDPTATP